MRSFIFSLVSVEKLHLEQGSPQKIIQIKFRRVKHVWSRSISTLGVQERKLPKPVFIKYLQNLQPVEEGRTKDLTEPGSKFSSLRLKRRGRTRNQLCWGWKPVVNQKHPLWFTKLQKYKINHNKSFSNVLCKIWESLGRSYESVCYFA